ncbi:hypothetical protein EVAR_66680_1 [Eumeta japonica]|uniref:Uncharacterized protein n=1 Tax=Eumeta variegata TaxID=151549 RepID=A0A4C1ZDD5_EUMVA|nr:hypothetical protein EVAR_66680_1 [Eumeta japonica]
MHCEGRCLTLYRHSADRGIKSEDKRALSTQSSLELLELNKSRNISLPTSHQRTLVVFHVKTNELYTNMYDEHKYLASSHNDGHLRAPYSLISPLMNYFLNYDSRRGPSERRARTDVGTSWSDDGAEDGYRYSVTKHRTPMSLKLFDFSEKHSDLG